MLWELLAPSGAVTRSSRRPPALEEYIRDFESSYRGARTLRADFTQVYTWGGKARVESGTVFLARGGLMRWDYREPNQKLFLSDGRRLLLYVPEEHQLTRSELKSGEDIRVPFRLLLSRLNLRKIFGKIEFADQAIPRDPGNRVLRAFPKPGYEGDYAEVLIELTPAFDVRRLLVTYPDRSLMEFKFDRVERNVALRPGLFRFNPPPGTEVIDQ